MTTVHGPDGRVWEIRRRPAKPGVAAFIAPGSWQVDATTEDEHRRWLASGPLAAGSLRDDVALALRTGSDGPPGEVAVTAEDADGDGPATG